MYRVSVQVILSRVSFREGWGGRICWEFYFTCKSIIKSLMMQEMVYYVCAKTVQDSTKLRVIKGPKPKFPRGACFRTPPPPSLPHALHLDTYLPHAISFCPPLGKKLKKTLLSLLYIGWRQNPLLSDYLGLADRFLFSDFGLLVWGKALHGVVRDG